MTETRTISGKELADLFDLDPQKYEKLYRNKDRQDYCPCIDVALYGNCHGMITVMDALKKR